MLIRIRKISDACDAYLSSPAEPDKYTLAPRAEEIEVIYNEPGTSSKRKAARLTDLLQLISTKGFKVKSVRLHHHDPARTLLDAAAHLHRFTGTASRIVTELRDTKTDISASKEWQQLRALIMQVLDSYPEAKQALRKELQKHTG